MASVLNYYKYFRVLPKILRENIKSFFVSVKNNNNLAFCVTNDDLVYGLGENIVKVLGYDNNEGIDYNAKYILMNELCGLNIDEFFDGSEFFFARTDENEIYCWGLNLHGQLLKGYSSDYTKYFKPEKVEYFDDKNIVQISCYDSHCLALSSDYSVYEWGYNVLKSENILEPRLLKSSYSFENHKFIHCGKYYQHTITSDGWVYRYDGNNWKLFLQLDMNQINQNSFDEYQVNFENNNQMKEECDENQFVDIFIDESLIQCSIVIETADSVYLYDLDAKTIAKSIYRSIFEYYLFANQSTHKTIHIKNDELFVIEFIDKQRMYKQVCFHEESQLDQDNKDSSKLKSLRASNDLPQSLESNVKCYYQNGGEDSGSYYALFVMYDGKFYVFGQNYCGRLGLGHDNRVYDYTLVPDLCNQNINEFFFGLQSTFAKNEEGEIFGWGFNDYGQLGKGYSSEELRVMKPEKIQFFHDKNIIQLCSGWNHCLALSGEGLVYGCGDNEKGQLGCGEGDNMVLVPVIINLKINSEIKFKFIHCINHNSFAVTTNGIAYCWGECMNDFEQGIHQFTPLMIDIDNVYKIYRNEMENCILLKSDGSLHEYFSLDKTVDRIKLSSKILDIHSDQDNILLQTVDCVLEIDCMEESVKKTIYSNFYDYFVQEHNTTYKTINITDDGYLYTKEIKMNDEFERKPNLKPLIVVDKNVYDRKYENTFEELKELGSGTFGTVFEVKHSSVGDLFAIKRVQMKNESDSSLNEIKIMSELKSDFVVQYINSWIEGKVMFRRITKFLFIQMELCSQNLKDVIQTKEQLFVEENETFIYFISCEIFKELIECVDYLHSLTPPVMHRDLKPENILITKEKHGRYFKLCDFGLAKIYENSLNTGGQGTIDYMAPEVQFGSYNLKSDIYSLALICTEIFHFKHKPRKIRKRTDL